MGNDDAVTIIFIIIRTPVIIELRTMCFLFEFDWINFQSRGKKCF